jgi:hypothetical protein
LWSSPNILWVIKSSLVKEDGKCNTHFLFYVFIAFLQSTQDIKRVINKRDGCEYLKQVPSIDGAYLMRSSGHILLSLLPFLGWLNRYLINWLLFCAVRFLWFFACVLMTSVTYGMPKSLCKVTFDMYQGVLASFLNVLDWNVRRIFVLEGLLQPHSSIS